MGVCATRPMARWSTCCSPGRACAPRHVLRYLCKQHQPTIARSSNISTDPPLAYLPEVGRQQLCRLFWQNMRPVANRCFADGGGLSHLSAQQRRTWIIAKRQAKADNQPMPTTWPLNQQPTAGGSASSAQTISDLELRLANHDAQIMKISSVYMGSPAHIDEFNTGLLAREWRPL